MKISYLANLLFLVSLFILTATGVVEIKTALFFAVFFLFTSAIAVISDRYQNK